MTSHWGRSLQTTARAAEKDCPKMPAEKERPQVPGFRGLQRFSLTVTSIAKAPQSERTAGLMKRG